MFLNFPTYANHENAGQNSTARSATPDDNMKQIQRLPLTFSGREDIKNLVCFADERVIPFKRSTV